MIIKRFNEGLRDKMTPRNSEELKKGVDSLPNHRKYYHIKKHGLENLYNEKELKDFEKDSPIIKKIGEWYNVEKDNKNYSVLIQGDDIGSIIVFETDNIEDIGGGHGYKLAPYDEWDEFEEIMEIITK